MGGECIKGGKKMESIFFLFLNGLSKSTLAHNLFTFFILLLFPSALILQSAVASDYSVQGHLFIHDVLTDPSGIGAEVARVDRHIWPVADTTIADSQWQLGPKGEVAKSEYYGSLATGKVGAFVEAVNEYDHNDDIWGETEATTFVMISDTIIFTIPAGAYQDGANAVLSGYADGSTSDSLYGQSRFGFVVHFGTEEYLLRGDGDHTQAHSMVYHKHFTLTLRLVPPGTVLNSDLTKRVGFFITFGSPATLVASTMGNKTGDKRATSARVLFNDCGVSKLSVPARITWTSASGVFLSQGKPFPWPMFLPAIVRPRPILSNPFIDIHQ
jgi:hypothetical protein